MRTIAISDIHGCLSQFDTLLDLLAYEPGEDRLVLVGDYVDRGPQVLETVERVRELSTLPHVTVLRGNHDHRFAEIAVQASRDVLGSFLSYGGVETLQSYVPGFRVESLDGAMEALAQVRTRFGDHLDFLAGLPLYHEDESHIYVHAGINPAHRDWRSQPDYDFMWIRNAFFDNPTGLDKTVVFGHTVVQAIHGKPDVWFGGDKIGIDGGCAYGMQLNALVIENGVYGTHRVRASR